MLITKICLFPLILFLVSTNCKFRPPSFSYDWNVVVIIEDTSTCRVRPKAIVSWKFLMGSSNGVSTTYCSCQGPRKFIISKDIVNKDLLDSIFTRALSFTWILRIWHSTFVPMTFGLSLSSPLKRVSEVLSEGFISEVVVLVIRCLIIVSCYPTDCSLSNDCNEVWERHSRMPIFP